MLLIGLADVEHLIISAIEETDLDLDNKSGEQSEVWQKVYEALSLLRTKAVDLKTMARKNGYYLKDVTDVDRTSEWC